MSTHPTTPRQAHGVSISVNQALAASAIRFTEDAAGKHYGCSVTPSVSFTCHLCSLWRLISLDFEVWGSSAVSEPQWVLTLGQCSPSFPPPSVVPGATAHAHWQRKRQSPNSHLFHTHKQECRETEWFGQIPPNVLQCSSDTILCCGFVRGCSCTCLLDWVQQEPHLPRGLWRCYHSLPVMPIICQSYIIDTPIFLPQWMTK